MVRQLHEALAAVRPEPSDTARFLLSYLSEPKAQVIFERPSRFLRLADFSTQARRHGIVLDRRTRFLYRGRSVGINGDSATLPVSTRRALQRLADRRSLPASAHSDEVLGRLHAWYCAGWLHLGSRRERT
jgi:50S ribosomal protein L16 3-hydroxylase